MTQPLIASVPAVEAAPFVRRRWLPLWLLITLIVTVLSFGALVMTVVAIVTLFQARRLYAEVIASWTGRIILRLCGLRLVIHRDRALSSQVSSSQKRSSQRIYISNHVSTVDMFALIAMGLPNTRFFLTGSLRWFVPMGVIGYLVGNFWTVPYKYPDKRRQIFQRADLVLRATGESVYLSPEGSRIDTGEIGKFNRGAFHLATSLQVPIQPFYIRVDRHSDPGRGWDVHPGEIHVFFKAPILTSDWRIEDLDENRRAVRERFLAWHEEHRQGADPGSLSSNCFGTGRSIAMDGPCSFSSPMASRRPID